MRNLPSGTLTFFFSDIEGSTRMLQSLGDRYPQVLERHRDIVRIEFGRRGGVEVNTQGDSFFAVFPQAGAAIVAAVAIQRDLASERWPEGTSLRIRIGLHTGEARVVAGDYVGLDVHRAARIMAAAHGGEIVASQATWTFGQSGLNGGIELRDLGEHRLRDLSAPERLFQVIADGLDVEFPPLRTLDRTPNNLPTQPTILVGRDVELERIRRHLDTPRVRLLTLTGPGGIGKTRLALQAAADQADRVEHGVYFVDLSHVDDAAGAVGEIASTLGIGIRPGGDARTTLAEQLRDQELLLVLDNFEQVMPAADDVAELLRVCPRLRVIVTSRESLRVRGEQLFPVAPLSFPDDPRRRASASDLSSFEAIRLFLERASEARPDFLLTDDNASAVADICAHLDGLPLAIELAAARLRLFSVEELRDRLGSSLDVLRGGARDLPARQRTLRDTIEWSHDLLDDDERDVFHLLSVFATARVDAVEEIASQLDWLASVDVEDVLSSLVDKSLVRGVPRLSMLDTIRAYAAEQLDLDSDRAGAARTAHAAYFSAFAGSRIPGLEGPARTATFDELAAELGNLLVAWRFYVDRADVGRLHALLDALWPLHESRGWYTGALKLLKDLLRILPSWPENPARVEKEITLRLSVARGLLAIRGYTDDVERLYNEAIALAENEGSVPRQLPVLRSLASFHLYRGEMDRTSAIGRKMLHLAETQGDPQLELEGHLILGPALAFLGNPPEGLVHLDRALELFDPDRHRSARFRLGPNPGVAAAAVSGLLHWINGAPETADRRAATALEFAERISHPYSLAYASFHVAMLDLWRDRPEPARQHALEAQAIAAANDYAIWTAAGLVLEGVAIAALGDPAAGVERTERGIGLYQAHPTPPVFWPQILFLRASALAVAGRMDDALGVLDEALAIAAPASFDAALIHLRRGELLAARGGMAAGEGAVRQSIEVAQRGGARAIELMAATRLAAMSEAGRALATASLQALLPMLTEGRETRIVREARDALDGALTTADA